MRFWQFRVWEMLLLIALVSLLIAILRSMYLSDDLPFISRFPS